MKKVSIVVPFHRGLSYLDDCFSSILEQELLQSEYEVICLGDSPEAGIF